MMYFSLTVLSTVGYGDYSPVATHEMGLCVVIMLMGVAVFSWIMGEVSHVLSKGTYSKDKTVGLNLWHL